MVRARFTAFSVQLSVESAIRQMGHTRLSRSHFWRQASWNLYETHVSREHLVSSWVLRRVMWFEARGMGKKKVCFRMNEWVYGYKRKGIQSMKMCRPARGHGAVNSGQRGRQMKNQTKKTRTGETLTSVCTPVSAPRARRAGTATYRPHIGPLTRPAATA